MNAIRQHLDSIRHLYPEYTIERSFFVKVSRILAIPCIILMIIFLILLATEIMENPLPFVGFAILSAIFGIAAIIDKSNEYERFATYVDNQPKLQ